MEECEICGKPTSTQYAISLEGAEMLVCRACSEGKHVNAVYGPEKDTVKPIRGSSAAKSANTSDLSGPDLIDNYGDAIRKARETLGLPMKVVAEKISEKESTLKRVEEQKMLPSPALVKKLEKELGIKLIAASEPRTRVNMGSKAKGMTLDDVAIKKDRKQ
ncbi:MAG: TIGR00270 family protein [Candidatus Micrarchaeota archaeon]|nr:TIGR00270 family protein [Candidatus Micrarchaeota archaeon]